MHKPYAEIAKKCFPKAIYLVDRYHWVRQQIWAFENVRKRVQKRLGKNHRLYFKRSRQLLLKHFFELDDEQKQTVLNILSLSDGLSTAYYYKERLYALRDKPDTKKKSFVQITDAMKQPGISELERCANTYYNWLPQILTSLEYFFQRLHRRQQQQD